MKILITGSHFTPAQATIEELQKHLDIEIVYVGRKFTLEGDKTQSVESQVLPEMGIRFIPIITGRLQRFFTIHTIPSLFKIPFGIVQSFFIVWNEHPDVVLSFGGYVAVPVVISSWLFSIPIILHEQTLVSGLANSISAIFADKIAVSFEENKEFNKNKTVLTGNPLRKEIFADEKLMNIDLQGIINVSKKENLPLILITGGNQGSHAINKTILESFEALNKIVCVIHQTGDSNFNDFEKLSEEKNNLKNPEKYLALKWIDGRNMGAILRKVDLVISRAGMNTLLELAYFGVPTLVIPLPYLYKNEQNVNAKFFEKMGLTTILSQNNLNENNLMEKIKIMLKNIDKLKESAIGAKKVVIIDAAKRLALETLLQK
ncbi:MAG: UDP-N-acetylglucosamine--N-acetylmuramyl-(pentapeptide) pyrophosphoryl-undecaprenol N-acetylglucosamine transferase [Candidatus Daviesbacteria bacterium]|nr:UDP-N-acetylglucosamine--N-acetylmuramyl-(pentapeptide) pyrophosphoryl-undecaprenol N-acetylglucosamine transferase [Candidatus Daviesbacteria bacterium]